MRIHMLTVSLVVLFASRDGVMAAQEVPTFGPGARVRVWFTSETEQRLVGRFLEMRGDTLFLQADGRVDTTRVPRRAVTSLDISLGKSTHAGTGALAGFVIGGGGGAL